MNGGLFSDESIAIPQFTDEIRDMLLENASSDFNWSLISPTIFGALFESTLNPVTRRSSGMHYTSVENIHKVIDPLFLTDLASELDKIREIKIKKNRKVALLQYQDKLGSLKFLDPACGSGNFLTETYLCLRRLENEVLRELYNGEIVLGDLVDVIKVNINQFYGIEINDFAVAVAKTAMWIAESQMVKETEDIVHKTFVYLPLKSNANIVEGNALRIDWESVFPKAELNYIMGNPPFVGARYMSASQKDDLINVFGKEWKNVGNLDYVSAWYKKAIDLMEGTKIKTALVSTNSICQGEQASNLWKPLMDKGAQIYFAWRTFRWDNEAKSKAHVHCVIIGFGCATQDCSKVIYNESGTGITATNINAYLVDSQNIFVESRNKPISKYVPVSRIGNKPIDDGNYLFSEEEYIEFVEKETASKKWFKQWIGAYEFINRKNRYCLWLGECSPAELRRMPECMKRVQAVRDFRLASKSAGTIKLADMPTRFHVETIPKDSYIVVPKVSSERRKYIPMGFLSKDVLPSDLLFVISDSNIYHFGVLTSNVHNAWMRTICGRLEMRYRYTPSVYNNFPWCNPTEAQRAKIEKTAQGILDARALYPDSSLADLYDELTMPVELRKAHQANDRAVMEAYGFWGKLNSESECVAELMKMYQKLVAE